MNKVEIDIHEIEENYTLHHTAWHRGYVSRRLEGYAERYEGRFGKGYRVFYPSWSSTTYCRVAYYIEEK